MEARITTADVIATLTEIRELLWKHRVKWTSAADRVLDSIADADAPTVKARILEMYGGAGSLNDIWICRENGEEVDDQEAANAELDRLTSRLWRQAQAL